MAAGKKTDRSGKGSPSLTYEPERVWNNLSENQREEVLTYADAYKDFLNFARTERRAVRYFIERAREDGFVPITDTKKRVRGYYRTMHGRFMAIAVPGKRPMTEGVRLIASHTDCPRLDLKANPLYEDTDLAFLKTHYYGGIKKYQWVARSLALVGTVVTTSGDSVDISIGLDPDDPVLTIPDLLPHLAKKQMEKKANEFMPAENLNVLAGAYPHSDEDSDQRVKLAILSMLHEWYGINEEDLAGADLQLVPAEPARDAGLDRSLIAGYGQDDRVCAYTSFTALMETTKPEHTAVVAFFDREETGSEGITGAQSRFLQMFLMDLMEKLGTEPTSRNLDRVYMNTKAMSADVNAALDPTYADVFERRNACRLGFGITIEKFSGHGGKYGASEAGSEYMAGIRKLLKDHNIPWQTGGHGKVDEGGGGTVAKFLARTGMEVIDIGPPILGMHSPVEVVAKDDVWVCHRAFAAFYQS